MIGNVTRILNAIHQGDTRAADELLPVVYEELRLLAAQKLSQETPGQTLQATSLVHEVYIRLVGAEYQNWDGQGHFFAAAAEAMRRILIENARRKKNLKSGGGQQKVNLEDLEIAIDTPSDDLIALDEALTKLADQDPEVADLVKLRYFAGFTLEEAARIQGVSSSTAGRYWSFARMWLYREITREDGRI